MFMTTPKEPQFSPTEIPGVQEGVLTSHGGTKAIEGTQNSGCVNNGLKPSDMLNLPTYVGVFKITADDDPSVTLMKTEGPDLRRTTNFRHGVALGPYDSEVFSKPFMFSNTSGYDRDWDQPHVSWEMPVGMARHMDCKIVAHFRLIKTEVQQGRVRVVHEPLPPEITGQSGRLDMDDPNRKQTSQMFDLSLIDEFEVEFMTYAISSMRPTVPVVLQNPQGDWREEGFSVDTDHYLNRYFGGFRMHVDQKLCIVNLYPQHILVEMTYKIKDVSLVNPRACSSYPSIFECPSIDLAGVSFDLKYLWPSQFGDVNEPEPDVKRADTWDNANI